MTDQKPNRSREEDLYDKFVDCLVKVVDPGGSPPDAASLNVVRAFLKDNNISADDDRHKGLKELKEKHKLPFGRPAGEEDE